jgi:ribosomal-protein-alanine N-acetyltransferase
VTPRQVRPLTAADATVIAGWRYGGPWSRYDISDPAALSSDLGYWAVEDATGRLSGFVCLGAEARVPGLGEEAGVVDVGVGVDPVLTGRGEGRHLIGPVLDWVDARTGRSALRAVVQEWNVRPQRLCRSLGFVDVGRHSVTRDGLAVDYVVLRRPAPTVPSITVATPADLVAVLELWRAAGAHPGSTDDLESLGRLLAHDPGALLLASDGAGLVGTVIAAWDGWRGTVYRLAVVPGRRRQGVAGALLGAAEERLERLGARRLQAVVVASDGGATGFWRAGDWTEQTDRLRFTSG